MSDWKTSNITNSNHKHTSKLQVYVSEFWSKPQHIWFQISPGSKNWLNLSFYLEIQHFFSTFRSSDFIMWCQEITLSTVTTAQTTLNKSPGCAKETNVRMTNTLVLDGFAGQFTGNIDAEQFPSSSTGRDKCNTTWTLSIATSPNLHRKGTLQTDSV